MADEWTLETTRAYFMAILDEREKRYTQRFTDLETALRAALAASEKAISKAETATERRFDSVNEFRQTLTDQTATFITREVFDEAMKTVRERTEDVKDRVTRSEGKGSGKEALWAYMVGAIGVISAIVAVATRF